MLKISIKTDNAALEGENLESEVARILKEIAHRIESGEDREGNVRDINGNKVGTFSLK